MIIGWLVLGLLGHSTPMSTRKTANFWLFLTVYYVPEISSLLTAIGAKLIGSHCGLQSGKKTVPDVQASWNDLIVNLS